MPPRKRGCLGWPSSKPPEATLALKPARFPVEKEALFVRAAMHDGTRHSPHDFVRNGSLLGEINNACDAAHENFLYFECRPLAVSQHQTPASSIRSALG